MEFHNFGTTTLMFMAYMYDNGWDPISGAVMDLYNYDDNKWDSFGTAGHELAWWYVKAIGSSVNQYINNTNRRVRVRLYDGWLDWTHVKWVRCVEKGESSKLALEYSPSTLESPTIPVEIPEGTKNQYLKQNKKVKWG
ncbi:MAG: hypothetical protein QMD71_01110 [bacterium]|nr:hypothetical protein [bacterium]